MWYGSGSAAGCRLGIVVNAVARKSNGRARKYDVISFFGTIIFFEKLYYGRGGSPPKYSCSAPNGSGGCMPC